MRRYSSAKSSMWRCDHTLPAAGDGDTRELRKLMAVRVEPRPAAVQERRPDHHAAHAPARGGEHASLDLDP